MIHLGHSPPPPAPPPTHPPTHTHARTHTHKQKEIAVAEKIGVLTRNRLCVEDKRTDTVCRREKQKDRQTDT